MLNFKKYKLNVKKTYTFIRNFIRVYQHHNIIQIITKK